MSESKTNNRLDAEMVSRGIVHSRSQAASYIRLGKVSVDGKLATKSGYRVDSNSKIVLSQQEQYVSRAALKLASVAEKLKLSFKDQVVLDVGSSTGGFTDFALRQGAKKVIAVDVGTNQLHSSLKDHPQIELHEKTDIRDFNSNQKIDMIVIDASFISLREILPKISKLASKNTKIIAMVKPQFEARNSDIKHKGVIKNDSMRRRVLKDFEDWVKNMFFVADKADSQVTGTKGNQERFYKLKKL